MEDGRREKDKRQVKEFVTEAGGVVERQSRV